MDFRKELKELKASYSIGGVSSSSSSSLPSPISSPASSASSNSSPFAVPEQPRKINPAFAVPEQPLAKKAKLDQAGVVNATATSLNPFMAAPEIPINSSNKNEDGCMNEEAPSLGPYEVLATEAITFAFVSGTELIGSCSPLFCHAFFGETEVIHGYKGLKIRLLYSSDRLQGSFDVQFDEKREYGVTNIGLKLNAEMPLGVRLQPRQQSSAVPQPSEQPFTPPGRLVHSFKGRNQFEGQQFHIYKGNVTDPEISEYNAKVQSLLKWWIDGVRYIDQTDENWTVYFVFRERLNGSQYDFAGVCTTYKFFALAPFEYRIRLAQIFVLPLFQRCGVASEILQCLYGEVRSTPAIRDLTVEDAGDDFTFVRDLADLRALLDRGLFHPSLVANAITAAGTNDGTGSPQLPKQAVDQIQAELKLYRPQIKHLFEAYRYVLLPAGDLASLRQFRLSVKRRLFKELVGVEHRSQQTSVDAANSDSLQEALAKDRERDAVIKKTIHEFYLLAENQYKRLKVALNKK